MEDDSQEFTQQHPHQSLQQQPQVEQEETTLLRDKLCISTRGTTLPKNIVTGVTIWSSRAPTSSLHVRLNHL